jgi:hypothetical protein
VGAKVAERRGGRLLQLHAVQGLLGLVGTLPLLLELAGQLLAPCLHLLAVKPPQHHRERRHGKLGPAGRRRLEGAHLEGTHPDTSVARRGTKGGILRSRAIGSAVGGGGLLG